MLFKKLRRLALHEPPPGDRPSRTPHLQELAGDLV